MTTTTIELPISVVDTIAAAVKARDEALARVDANASDWDKALVDQAIDAMAFTGETFSANDLRPLIPSDIPGCVIGHRFNHAANNRGVIRFVGLTRSTKENTHRARISLWKGVPTEGAPTS